MLSRLRAALLPLVAVLLLLLPVCACAEDAALAHDHVELFSEGYLPSPPALPAGLQRASTFSSYIIAELEKQTAEIDVSSYNMDVETFKNAYWAVLNSRPDLFYVSGGFSYYHTDDVVTGLLPNYKYTGSDLKKRISAFNKGISRIVSYANQASTAIGKLLLVNDYLCVNYEYDTSYAIYSPDEMLSEGKGVCQAYMLLCRAVLNELGFRSDTATSNEMNHTWNVVYLDGSWYHIDVTWNDPLSDRPLGAYHNNFLLSDSGISDTGHYNWDFSTTAGNTQYDDFFWTDITCALPVLSDTVYYLEPDMYSERRKVKSWAIGSAAHTTEYTFSASSGGQVFFTSDGDPFWADDKYFYYGVQSTLYTYDRSSKLVRAEYDTGDDSLLIRRLFRNGGTLQMYLEDQDDYSGTLFSLTLEAPLTFTLPADTTSIAEEAFAGISCEDLILPQDLASIGARAFADCLNLLNVYLPASNTEIADDAFEGCGDQVTFICPEGSSAQAFAQEHGFSCVLME